MDTKNEEAEQLKFVCAKCNYICYKKYNLERHNSSDKHIRIHNRYKMDTSNELNEQITNCNKNFKCVCGKEYKYSQGLSKHKQTCNLKNNNIIKQPNVESSQNELISYLMKENNEFKEMLLEQNKLIMKMSETCGNNNNNVNSHNKTFNLNLFLNETCKDAMNIMDFVDSVKLQLSDLETIGNTGFVNGISKIIIKNLKNLDVTKRPLHCTDSKREVLYVKDEDKWEKENDEKDKLKKVINTISHKNIQQISTWSEQNPKYKDSESNQNTEYLKIVNESMGCADSSNYNKIIHNISKEVIVDK